MAARIILACWTTAAAVAATAPPDAQMMRVFLVRE